MTHLVHSPRAQGQRSTPKGINFKYIHTSGTLGLYVLHLTYSRWSNNQCQKVLTLVHTSGTLFFFVLRHKNSNENSALSGLKYRITCFPRLFDTVH